MNDQWLQEALANVDGLVAIATTHGRLSNSVRPGFERARAGLEAHLRTALAAPPASTDGAPPELWLQLHGDGEPDGKPVDYKADVSWCWEQIYPHDVRYVLAAAAEPTDELLRIGVRAFQSGFNGFDNLSDWRACFNAWKTALASPRLPVRLSEEQIQHL